MQSIASSAGQKEKHEKPVFGLNDDLNNKSIADLREI